MKKAIALAALLLIQSIATAEAVGNPDSKVQKEAIEDEFSLKRLNQPIELPAVAEFTGRKKFLTGTIYPNAKSGAAISLIYTTSEQPCAVLAWYRDMLKQYEWSVVPAMMNQRTVAARRKKNLIQIMTSPASKAGYSTDILIRYKLASTDK